MAPVLWFIISLKIQSWVLACFVPGVQWYLTFVFRFFYFFLLFFLFVGNVVCFTNVDWGAFSLSLKVAKIVKCMD